MRRLMFLSIVFASLVFGYQGDYKNEVTITGGGVKPEGNLDLKNELNFGLRYGTYLDSLSPFDMLEFGYERASSVKYKNSTFDTNINRYFINLVKEYELSKKTAIYSLIGVGYEDFTKEMFDNEDEGFFQYGVGIKHWIMDSFALKAEIRHAINFDSDNNLFYNLGFVIPFGKVTKNEPIKVEEEKIVEPEIKPIETKVDKKVEVKKPVKITPPKDSDRDGVIDDKDKCPNTPPNRVVDSNGCIKVITLRINFEYDKAEIPNSYNEKLQETVNFLRENPEYRVKLEGHTDSRGSFKYNQKLSEKRAKAVADALIGLGIGKERISYEGYGENLPVASNATKEGRALNRRVEAKFYRY